MIGITDTLELNAVLHGNSDRVADRIFGITKKPHSFAPHLRVADPAASPLRSYTRAINSLPGGIGHTFINTSPTSQRLYAA